MVKIIVGVDVSFVEHGSRCVHNTGSVDNHFRGQWLIEMRVLDGESDLLAIPCRCDGRGTAEPRESLAGVERSAVAVASRGNGRVGERGADTRCSEFGSYCLRSAVRQV